MFRPMRRAKQALSLNECQQILMEQPRGVLSVLGDSGYPYGLPMTHYFDVERNVLCFHCAAVGHKIDAIRRSDKVSFCVLDQGYRREGEWALNIKSVIVFGRIREITDVERKTAICTNLVRKFTDDEAYLTKELSKHLHAALCLEMTTDHISGKLVNES